MPLTLEHCGCGFGQFPTALTRAVSSLAPRIPTTAGQVKAELVARVRAPVEAEVRRVVGDVRGQVAAEASKVFREMGLPPGVPFVPPTDLSAKGVADAAFRTGKAFAEKRIQEATGVPVQLPAKLSAKELAKSVGALIPTDIEGALDTALAIGAQAAAGALTAALVGAGIGSVVPGLGTIIGIGAALGVAALKGVIIKLFQERGLKCERPWTCPPLPPQMSMMELLPWMVTPYLLVRQAIIAEGGFQQGTSLERCVRGQTVDCAVKLRQVSLFILERVGKTPEAMGLPQLERLIPQYEVTLDQWRRAAPSLGIGTRGFATGGASSMEALLLAMKARRDKLVALLERANRALQSGARAELSAVRWEMVNELKTAGVQVSYAPGPETLGWFKRVADYVTLVDKADKAAQQAMHQKLAVARARGEERLRTDPRARERLAKQQEALRRSESQAVVAPPKLSAEAARGFCARLFQAWLSDPKNQAQARCLGPADHKAIADICFQAHGIGTVSPATALQMIDRQIKAACARQARPLRGLGGCIPALDGCLPVAVFAHGTPAAEIARQMQ